MKKILALIGLTLVLGACDMPPQSSDDVQRAQQEKILAEGTAQTGMPAIKNFRERKILKDIIEMRDQTGLVTYTYTFSEVTGKFSFLCQSIGYPLPYATQYTNPSKLEGRYWEHMYALPQADPNGLFSPSNAEGTWVLCKDPKSDKVAPVYAEPKVTTLQWPMDSARLAN